jgi:hypothetical protein
MTQLPSDLTNPAIEQVKHPQILSGVMVTAGVSWGVSFGGPNQSSDWPRPL